MITKLILNLSPYLIASLLFAGCIGDKNENTRGATSNQASLPTAPNIITIANSRGFENSINLDIAGVSSGDVLRIYSDSSCNTQLASSTANSSTVQITVSNLTVGSHTFYATKTTDGKTSACSAQSVSYELRQKFISTWRTTAASETITLPLVASYNYDLIVDWGDGSQSTIFSDSDSNKTHTYTNAGDYTVTISGTMEAFSFNNLGDRLKLIEVVNLGDLGWINLSGAFYGCQNLLSFAGGKTNQVIDMSHMFHNTYSLITLDLYTFDTTNVTDMSYMFSGQLVLTELDTSNFNTSQVNNMSYMFQSLMLISSLNLSSFDTLNVTDMRSMFFNARELLSLDLTGFDTSNVTNMNSMFSTTLKLTTINLSSFDTRNVTSMSGMFSNASQLINLDLSHFDVSKVTTFDGMFRIASRLQFLNLANWNTQSAGISAFMQMFEGMSAGTTTMTSLDLSHFNTTNSRYLNSTFRAINVAHLNLSGWNTSSVQDVTRMFEMSQNLISIDTSGWNISSVATSTDAFNGKNPSLQVYCNQGGSPGTGTFFTEICN